MLAVITSLSRHQKQGNNMPDTIDLLEAIGRNAAWRHAQQDDLAAFLAEAEASDVLQAAVAASDPALLEPELGYKYMHTQHVTQGPAHEDDPDHDDDDGDGDGDHEDKRRDDKPVDDKASPRKH